MLISTALLLDSIIRNSVCTPAKLPCRRVEVGYEKFTIIAAMQMLQLFVDFASAICYKIPNCVETDGMYTYSTCQI
jgi:hypothetical protein